MQPIGITQIQNGAGGAAFFDLNATSTDAAQPLGSGAAQHYAGTFSIFSGVGMTGTNFLSGSFTDLVFGTGTGGALAVGAPPDLASFTSDVITSLSSPLAVGLAFTNIAPGFAIVGTSIGSFTSNVSGTFSGQCGAGAGDAGAAGRRAARAGLGASAASLVAEAPPNGNGGHTTVVQAAIKLGGQVAHRLAPQFLALILVNILFSASCSGSWMRGRGTPPRCSISCCRRV